MIFTPSSPGPDYTLRWPRSLFASEGKAVLRQPENADMVQEAELLLEDAFVSDEPRRDFITAARTPSPFDPAAVSADLASRVLGQDPRRQFLRRLVAAADQLLEEAPPRPYYAARTGNAPTTDPWTSSFNPAHSAWRAEVTRLQERGYLDQAAPWLSGDRHRSGNSQDALLDRIVQDRLGGALWWSTSPTRSDWWSDAEFFSLVEVFHDLIARPRRKHERAGGETRYAGFAVEPGRALYRWTVNRLLERHAVDLRLAEDGEDVGRLVHAPTDGRQDLIETAISKPSGEGDKVRHAVALFRSRDASVEDKRSACIALAGILEARRNLLKDELLSKDEGALFNIANNFALRHHDARQQRDYAEAYLDWIYWWYLATVELTDRLLARQNTASNDV